MVPPPHAVIPRPRAAEARMPSPAGQFRSTSCNSLRSAQGSGECWPLRNQTTGDSTVPIVEGETGLCHLAAVGEAVAPETEVGNPVHAGPRQLGRLCQAGAHQVRQTLAGIMGWPTLQPKALPNSSKFCTVPLTRHLPGECGSVLASTRGALLAWRSRTRPGRSEMKKRCCRRVAVVLRRRRSRFVALLWPAFLSAR